MEEGSRHTAETLYLFECKSKHRITRKSMANNSNCSRCDPQSSFAFLGGVPRKEGETEVAHQLRTLDHGRARR